jgi:hypothetical protein
MSATISAKRQNELERLLRRLRQRCFESDKAAALIPIVKARLAPAWSARVDLNRAKRDTEFMFLWN